MPECLGCWDRLRPVRLLDAPCTNQPGSVPPPAAGVIVEGASAIQNSNLPRACKCVCVCVSVSLCSSSGSKRKVKPCPFLGTPTLGLFPRGNCHYCLLVFSTALCSCGKTGFYLYFIIIKFLTKYYACVNSL